MAFFVSHNMDILIREPHLHEYPTLIDLWEASVRATHYFLTENDIQAYWVLVASYLPGMDIYCAAKADEIMGFIGINDNMVQALFIHPNAIGTGVGKQLMTFAIHHKHITGVDVNEQNTQAIGFYEKLGFEVTSRSERDGAGKPYPILSMELV
jgi:putative acetyltransferase